MNTVAFVTNQYNCDRIILAAKKVADKNNCDLLVVGIMDNKYPLDPKVVDYLFTRSKESQATMHLIFREDNNEAMREIVGQHDCKHVVSGMPSSNNSIIYNLWKEFPQKDFYTVDTNGKLVEVVVTMAAT